MDIGYTVTKLSKYYQNYPKIPHNLFGRSAQSAKIFGIFEKKLSVVRGLGHNLPITKHHQITKHTAGFSISVYVLMSLFTNFFFWWPWYTSADHFAIQDAKAQ
jgi:hypothetical protein